MAEAAVKLSMQILLVLRDIVEPASSAHILAKVLEASEEPLEAAETREFVLDFLDQGVRLGFLEGRSGLYCPRFSVVLR